MIFYSYLWLREDGTPYYAGKGTGRRAFMRFGHRCHPPKDKSNILIFPMLTSAEAFESEVALIELFGRKDNGTGCLRNLTDGGENPPNHTGKKRTEATLQKMRIAQKGHRGNWGSTRSEETKERMRVAQIGKKHTSETIAYMRIVRASVSEETKDKIRKSLEGVPWSEKRWAAHIPRSAWNKGLSIPWSEKRRAAYIASKSS